MSFKELLGDGSFFPKKKEISIKHGDKTLVFYANQIPYLEVLAAAVGEHQGKNVFALQISKSITDAEGEHMTYEQALMLPDEIARQFWEAAAEVNKREESEKN